MTLLIVAFIAGLLLGAALVAAVFYGTFIKLS